MFSRQIERELAQVATEYPVVSIMGPRQSGKTTLARKHFTNKPYANLENPSIRSAATSDPLAFLKQYPEGAILDEIQHVPELFSYIQTLVDEKQQAGQFVLTGNQQFNLHAKITQSLAGRTALLNLLPLSLYELQNQAIDKTDVDSIIHRGFYPKIYDKSLDAHRYYHNYLQTYVERDVRQLSHIQDLQQFHRFIKLCAGRIGQVFHIDNVASELGIARQTVKNWLSVLQASFIIYFLEPYFENFGKRIIKSPKLYFYDCGLACFLLDIINQEQLSRDPLRGALYENMVIMELIKYRYNSGLSSNLYFYNNQNRYEIDVVYKTGHQLIPIEIKSTQTFKKEFLKNIRFFSDLIDERVAASYVIYAGDYEQNIQQTQLINFWHSHTVFNPDNTE